MKIRYWREVCSGFFGLMGRWLYGGDLMKIFYLLLIALIILPESAFNQGWNWQNPLPQGNRLSQIQFVDSLHGWILSEYGGSLLRTINGGSSWEISAMPLWTNRIHFVDRLNGWCVGSGAPPFIMRTSDGGKTWEDLPIPEERNTGDYYNFYGLHFLDVFNGYITDSARGIFYTPDGGLTWVKQRTILPPREIRSIWFVDSLRGWAIGETPLLYTNNGGNVWLTDSTVIGGIDARPRKILFTDSLHGWILMGTVNMYRTADGGGKWTRHIIDSVAVVNDSDPKLGEFISKDLLFLDPQQGWLATSWGLYSSSDSGKTWKRFNREYSFAGVHFFNSMDGWATGGTPITLRNDYFKTSDGGVTWESQTSRITGQTLWGVDFVDEMTGWAVGSGGTIIHTKDGGKTWVHQTSPSRTRLRSVNFWDKKIGWILGFGGVILHTRNGGEIWWQQNSGTDYELEQASFVSPQEGWVVGWSDNYGVPLGIVLHTIDGGNTWHNQTPQGIGRLHAVYFIDSLRGWIATGGGTIEDFGNLYRTLEGGKTWEPQITQVNDSFYRIWFVDALHGWVAGQNGILRTINGGNSWEMKSPAISASYLVNIRFVDPLHGWAVGVAGAISYTSDGGETWTRQQSKTSITLEDLDFVNKDSGWAVGGFGTVLHTESGGMTTVKQSPSFLPLPSSFELYQNYPNPFNSQTILSFRLDYSGAKVTVDIYNLHGQLVTTLLDDQLAVGHHHVMWDGTDQDGKRIGSGVYLYQIRINRQTKGGKMILLR